MERLPTNTSPNSVSYSTPEYRPDTELIIHLHPKIAQWVDPATGQTIQRELVPMFSAQDVISFYAHISANNSSNITSMLVTANGVYALKVKSKSKMNAIANLLDNNTPAGQRNTKALFDAYKEKVLKACDGDDSCYAEKFATFIKTFEIDGKKLGINFYSADNVDQNTTGCPNIQSWTRN